MLRQDVDEEDLRTEILNLRKHIARVCSENRILKVKIKKLQCEMIERDHQLDDFLNSKRFFGLAKKFQDKGVSVLVNLKLKIDKLEQGLLDKELMIRRLQNTLQTAKLYNANSLNKKFVSKGTECALIMDNKLEFFKKENMNTKIELHLPQFDIDDIDEYKETVDSVKEVAMNRRKLNSVQSNFLLDINFDLKQGTKPSCFSEARYERCTSYHVEAKESKSDDTMEKSRIISKCSPIECNLIEDDYTERHQYQIQKNHIGKEDLLTPTFRRILQTIEELMNQGKMSANLNKKASTDQCIQFPAEDCLQFYGIPDQIISTQEDQNKDLSSITYKKLQIPKQTDPGCLKTTIDQTESDNPKEDDKIVNSEMPHEEIKQLHIYLMDMISQVDNLKDTIFQMKNDQEKTEIDLRSKNESIEKLAREIEQLRELKLTPSKEHEKVTKSTVKLVEKEVQPVGSLKSIQKATEDNIKKIAGKMKHIKESKSKSSLLSQPREKKSSRSSSKNSRPEKRRSSGKENHLKSDKKLLKTPRSKNVFEIGNGDVVDVPYFRCGLAQKSCDTQRMKTEFDELD